MDISHLATIDIKNLSEEETDSWCAKIFKYSPNESELNKTDFWTLFQFTRSLLNVKHIQTDVLLEELQNIEQKYEDIQNELDVYKNKSDAEIDLREQLDDREKKLRDAIQHRQVLTSELEQKDRELMQLRSHLSSPDSGLESDRSSDEIKLRLREKNEQIEQLLDKLYDSDRINLDLAEQVAKLRVDLTKSDNDNQQLEARCQMLEKQIKELEILNENLMQDRERRDQELNRLRKELDRSQTSNDFVDSSEKIDFYQKMTKEIEKLNTLLKVKDSEIFELREIIHKEDNNKSIEQLAERRDQIERLEEELSILSEGLICNVCKSTQNDKDNRIDQIQNRKLNRRIRKLKKQTQLLQLRTEELEEEARHKDEELAKERKRMSMWIGGDDNVKKLLEENSVLSRMVRFRDNRIEFLINQLNKHQLVSGSYTDQDKKKESLCCQQDIELRDQLIALTVERDVLQRQNDAVKTHLETVHNENLELQIGMKEILEGIHQSDATTDLVLECPSLERVCRLMENRSIYLGLNSTDNEHHGADLTQMILLKSELDHVRGQNEQLRNELKNLRADFLSVIDEYTNDIMDNWTMSSATIEVGSASLSNQNTTNNDTDQIFSEECKDVLDFTKKSNEKIKSKPRSRVHRKLLRNKSIKSSKRIIKNVPSANLTSTGIVMIDIALDPIQINPEEERNKLAENKLTPTSEINEGEKTETELKIPLESEMIPQQIEQQKNEIIKVNNGVEQEQPIHLKQKDDDDHDIYVFMCDSEVQAVPSFSSRSMQTEEWKSLELKTECLQCVKYLSMLDSARQLTDKERQQFRLQENKQSEMVNSLKRNLKLIKKEYQLDIEAKNEELKDLRAKMIQLSISNHTVAINDTPSKPEQNNKLALMVATKKTTDDDDLTSIAKPLQLITANDSIGSNQNKAILETIIECLQKCLKQKDEALEEYRSLMEQMRETYSNNYSQTISSNVQAVNKKICNNQTKEDNNFLQMEKMYEDLFVKPKIEENDQLVELLRSTLHKLDSVRTKSREQIKQLEIEIETKSRLILELESKVNKLTKQLDANKNQIQSMKAQSKVQEEKIQTLTIKLNEMIRRNQQSIQTATALKKKVENSVFQESADLRSKISELSAEVRRLEVEKWNVEKRLDQERQSARERLAERNQHVAQLSQQMSKLQTLIVKMEKKLLVRKQQSDRDQQIAAKKDSQDRAVQTLCEESLNHIVRFNPFEIQTEKEKKKLISTNLKTKIKKEQDQKQHQRIQAIEFDEITTASTDNRKPIKKEQKKISDSKKRNKLIEEFQEQEELDSSRQIVIDEFRREQMSTVMNEISIVGNELIKPTTMDCHQSIDIMKSSSCSSRETSSICPECESKFNAHQIEQHLIDLRLERLLDENLRLKLDSNVSNLDHIEFDCNTIK